MKYTWCQSLGIKSDVVNALVAKSAEAMWNPEYGVKGGMPYGGSCLPKDTRAFRTFAQESNLNPMLLLDAVIKVNEEMGEPVDVAQMVQQPENYAGTLDLEMSRATA
jgi:UDPglucose 6-dehydrogenase